MALTTWINDTERTIASKFEVCPDCKGSGTSTAYLGAYTSDELDEAGPEFLEDVRAGNYDRACDLCGGLRVVEVPDTARMSPAEIEGWNLEQREAAADAAMAAAERRAGC